MFNKTGCKSTHSGQAGQYSLLGILIPDRTSAAKQAARFMAVFLWTDTWKSTTSFPPYKDKDDTKGCLRR